MISRAGPVTVRDHTGQIVSKKPAYNPATASRIINGMSEAHARQAVRNRLRSAARARAKAKLPGVGSRNDPFDGAVPKRFAT